MNYRYLLLGASLLAVFTSHALGHGSPIHFDVVSGVDLSITNGLALTNGFADLAFDPSEEAGLDFPGLTVRTDLPGFDVAGVSSGAVMQLEVLSRRDLSDPTRPMRWMWYWDSTAEVVREADHDPDFSFRRKDLLGTLSVDQYTTPASSILNVTDSLTPDSHQHYLRYELDNSPAAEFGVYGVFARMKSPGFTPTEPFLLAFSYGVTAETYSLGTLAINLAAGLRGDYDSDGDVDGRDFLVWQSTHGSTAQLTADGSLNDVVDAADLAIWQSHYGKVLGELSAVSTLHVPEPTAIVLVFTFALLVSQKR